MPGMQDLSWPFLKAALGESTRIENGLARAVLDAFIY